MDTLVDERINRHIHVNKRIPKDLHVSEEGNSLLQNPKNK
jgi:hypothetical protein